MRIGSRNFPYPVLNQNATLTDYKETSRFALEFDAGTDGALAVDGGNLVLKNACYSLADPGLEDLVLKGSVAGLLTIECSWTLFRRSFPLSTAPTDICVPAQDLSGKVEISAYLFATEPIQDFRSEGFLDDYASFSFDVEPHDIVAVDDGVSVTVSRDMGDEDRVASIFTVIKSGSTQEIVTYLENGRGIVIQLPPATYDAYDNLKMHSDYNNAAFAMMAIPVLAACLDDLKHANPESTDDITSEHTWFASVQNAYERECKTPLTLDGFLGMSAFELSQIVLNHATCRGLADFHDLLFNVNGEDEAEDE